MKESMDRINRLINNKKKNLWTSGDKIKVFVVSVNDNLSYNFCDYIKKNLTTENINYAEVIVCKDFKQLAGVVYSTSIVVLCGSWIKNKKVNSDTLSLLKQFDTLVMDSFKDEPKSDTNIEVQDWKDKEIKQGTLYTKCFKTNDFKVMVNVNIDKAAGYIEGYNQALKDIESGISQEDIEQNVVEKAKELLDVNIYK